MNNLILTGGIFHEFVAAAQSLAALLTDCGFVSTITDDMDGGLAELASGRYRLLTVYALRWRMLNGAKYDPYRPRWAFDIKPEQQQAVARHVSAGGGLLGIHTASLCFDNWAGWKDLLGTTWVWGKSFHPEYGRTRVHLADDRHPIIRDLPDFELNDEVFQSLDSLPAQPPLMLAQTAADQPQAWHPVLWARNYGQGRVVYDALGHDSTSFGNAVHAKIIARSALWASGVNEQEIAASSGSGR
jgi:type 1 glutamine amidotransferase